MTRIRKSWSSSRGTEEVDVDPQPPRASVAFHEAYVRDTEGKPKAPLMFQPADDYGIQMLAAVTVQSMGPDSSIRNLKRENVPAQVIAALKAKSRHREPDLKFVKRERDYTGVWGRSDIQGLVRKSSSKSNQSYDRKHSALRNSDHGSGSLPKKVEVVDSDLTARVERAKTGSVGKLQSVISGHCLEREPSTEETPTFLHLRLDFGHSTGRKRSRKRSQQPWKSDLEHVPSATGSGTDQKPVTSEVRGVSTTSTKLRRLIIVRTPQDQATCQTFIIRAGSTNGVTGNGKVNEDEPGLTTVLTNDVMRKYQPNAGSEEVREDVDDRNELKEKADKVVSAVDDREKHTEEFQEAGIIDHLDAPRSDSAKVDSRTQQKSTGEDIFPKKWKYKGLAEIAEKDKALSGKQCARTDGHSWQCPLRAVEGFALCQHHLNKVQLKKLLKSNAEAKDLTRKSKSKLQFLTNLAK